MVSPCHSAQMDENEKEQIASTTCNKIGMIHIELGKIYYILLVFTEFLWPQPMSPSLSTSFVLCVVEDVQMAIS